MDNIAQTLSCIVILKLYKIQTLFLEFHDNHLTNLNIFRSKNEYWH